jgi:hypothetical protein
MLKQTPPVFLESENRGALKSFHQCFLVFFSFEYMPSSIVVVKRAQTVASASKDKSEKEARFYKVP